jgi:murein DD-endopeptidase MepM/ murein hydrolase activator NlpD
MRDVARSAKHRMVRTSTTLARTARPASGAGFRKPLRSVVILSMVGGLVATVALPAYAAFNTSDEAMTIEQVAADNAQSLVVASDVTTTELSRGSYAATTAEEVEKKKAAEAAAERAAAAAAAASAAASTSSSSSTSRASADLTMVAPGSGAVRWPLDMSNIRVGRGFGADGYHQGIDLLGPQGTPEYAAAAGTVRVAGNYYGYGNAVVLDSVINGQTVSTLYGHMVNGGVLVTPGQYVEAGQIIGLMGSTGSSTANHLHFEVRLNGGNVDPYAWLLSNAG